MGPNSIRSYVVRKDDQNRVSANLETLSLADLPPGDVVVQVDYSSINYKDALAATGHPGVAPNLPHVPGIDAVGQVIESSSDAFPVGAQVLINGHDFGSTAWGAWSEVCRVPADWAILQPQGLSPEETIILGTAGFTAAQCVAALESRGIQPADGPIVVTGATGGVGCFSIAILAKLGFEVTAVTGKQDQAAWLKSLGAAEVVGREVLQDESDRPMLSRKWAGGVDAVGGVALTTMLRQLKYGGAVAACGLAASPDLSMTVYPFILRGVALLGIDSAWVTAETRTEIWQRLASDYRIDHLERFAHYIGLANVADVVQNMLNGQITGRTVVRINDHH